MKKIFFLLLTTIILSACGHFIPIGKDLMIKYPYNIRSVDVTKSDEDPFDEKNTCVYELATPEGVDYGEYIDVFSITDSIGKFNLNDQVYLTLEKIPIDRWYDISPGNVAISCPYHVIKINRFNDDNMFCKYRLIPLNENFFIHRLWNARDFEEPVVIDMIGKFNINDNVYFSVKKY